MTTRRFLSHPAAAISLLIMAGASPPEPPPGELRPTSCGFHYGDRVFFDIGSVDLRPDAMENIIRTADFFLDYPAEITIDGHTDAHFPEEKSEAVGWLRAEAVRDAFIARGYPFELIRIVSYRDKRPAVLGNNEDAWAQNRRVIIVAEEFLLDSPEVNCADELPPRPN